MNFPHGYKNLPAVCWHAIITDSTSLAVIAWSSTVWSDYVQAFQRQTRENALFERCWTAGNPVLADVLRDGGDAEEPAFLSSIEPTKDGGLR